MIENVMNKIGGVGMFGVISICIFFAFFTGMLVWLVCLKESYLESMCELPLDRQPGPEPKTGTTVNSGERYE
jgi:hypothetical protein